MNYYDKDGSEISILEWGQKMQDPKYKIVAKTKVRKALVSTVWLGINHQFGTGPPLIFETMVFGENEEDITERYSKLKAAEMGHHFIVAKLRKQRHK